MLTEEGAFFRFQISRRPRKVTTLNWAKYDFHFQGPKGGKRYPPDNNF